MIEIEDLTGDFADFLAETFNRKPQFRERALPNVAEDLMGVEDFDDLLHSETIKFPYFKINLNGQGVPEQGYTRDIVVQGETQTRVVDPEKAAALYRAGGTLTWASINHYNSKVRAFTRMVAEHMCVRVDAVGFMTPAGKKGYPAHHDGVDLFIVQLSGSKRWRLWDVADDRRSESASYDEDKLGAPVIDRELKAGDVLYLPYGTPHQAMALDEPSLHLSVMMRPRMWRHLLEDLVSDALDSIGAMEYPPLAKVADGVIVDEFRGTIDALLDELRSVDVAEAWEHAREHGRNLLGGSAGNVLASSVRESALTSQTLLRRNSRDASFSAMTDGRTMLESGGLRFALETALARRVENIPTGTDVVPSELIGDDASPERVAALTKALVRLGAFEPVQG